ncbi:hypothetical protein GQ457_12G014910 [Hibiscus cannabinus]
MVHVRNQKHDLTPPRDSILVTTVYKQAGGRCLYSRHPLCHLVEAEHRSSCIEEVEASTIDSKAIID